MVENQTYTIEGPDGETESVEIPETLIELMQEGDKWQLVIPPQLAYAEKGAPPVIPPNSALVFEVELLEVLESSAAEGAEGGNEG